MDKFAYYYALKDEARNITANAINRKVKEVGDVDRWKGITLCSILNRDVGDALAFARREWPKFYGDDTHHGFHDGWDALVHRFGYRSDHFDLAIWQEVDGEQVLVALALGNPSHAQTHLTLKWVERFFGYSHLAGRALWPILTSVEEYARLVGCERVLIKDAVDPTKYERYGYAPYRHPNVSHGGNYLARELSDD